MVERRSRRFSSERLERVARRLMNASPLCALATVSPGGRAHINHMYFAWSDRYEVIWISDPESLHSRNLTRNSSAAVTIYASNQVWGRPRRGAFPQDVFLDLSRRGLGQLRNESHPVRGLEVRQAIPGERDQLGLGGRRAGLQHHVRERRLSPLLVRQTDDRRLLDSGMAKKYTLDLQARDVLSSADDHVFDPVTDLDVAIRVEHGGVAGVEPPVAHHLLGRVGVVVVTLHDHVAAGHYLAQRLAVGGYVLPGLIDDAQLA